MAQPRARDQLAALMRSFLARFFENEITAGTDDLKNSFFWLLAFLMAPGAFIPILMSFDWEMVARFEGVTVLQVVTRGDKAFYLGFSMVASAVIGAIAWSSVLVDRRDALILGAAPVRPAVVVQAKLAALGAYILLIAVGMHTAASLSFGVMLATRAPFSFMLRSIAAHFIVPCAASAFVVLAIAAGQGVALAVTGPRSFARLSPILQLALVAGIVTGLITLPLLNISVVHTLQGAGRNMRPWLLQTPPLWFLGAYEWVLGARDPVLMQLARRAVLALAAVTVLTLTSYPIAYRRLMVTAVETGGEFGRTGALARILEGLTRTVARLPQRRAVAQFFLSSLFRVARFRFVLAASLGVAVAWGLPAVFALFHGIDAQPAASALSLPLATMIFLLAGLRIAAALPADMKAGWLFEVHSLPRRQIHAALERIMLAVGVVTVVAICAPAYAWLWGKRVAVAHTVVSMAVGMLVVELLLWRFDGMPSSRPWDPGQLRVGRRSWAYLTLFIIFTAAVPAIERRLIAHTAGAAIFVTVVVSLAAAVRFVSLRQPPRSVEQVDEVTGGVLNLE